MTTSANANMLRAALTATLLIGIAGFAYGEEALSGSEARRAEFCAGDYVCDEDGSWSIADVTANEQAMRLSDQAIDKAIRDGKVVAPDRSVATTQRLTRD